MSNGKTTWASIAGAIVVLIFVAFAADLKGGPKATDTLTLVPMLIVVLGLVGSLGAAGFLVFYLWMSSDVPDDDTPDSWDKVARHLRFAKNNYAKIRYNIDARGSSREAKRDMKLALEIGLRLKSHQELREAVLAWNENEKRPILWQGEMVDPEFDAIEQYVNAHLPLSRSKQRA